jgi:hypothetical protein
MRRACHGGSSRGTTGEAIAKPIGHRPDRAPSPGMFGRQVVGRLNLGQCRAMPRQLTDDERRLLDGLLANDFDGEDALQIQATSETARRGCKCGCGTIELVPAQPNAPRSTARSPVPAEGRVFDDEGKEIGGLLLFLEEGQLRSLEIYSFDQPLPLPKIENVIWHQLPR